MSWKRIRGHDRQIEAFDRVLKRERLAHAYLFVGPDGIGKRLFAHELGKALLCENRAGKRLEACDQCAGCHLVDAQTHPDLVAFARPEERLEFPVEIAQEMCRSLALKPARGRYRVVVLEDADDLNEESSNCLLKTLEEPPPGSVLILVGTSPERQLKTIVSRCQVVRFEPLSPDIVTEILREQETATDNIERLAGLSGGSPGMAREMSDPSLWEFRRTLLAGLTSSKPDPVSIARAWTQMLDETGKDAAAQRRRSALVLRMLVEFFQDVLRVSTGLESQTSEPEEQRLASKLAERVDAEQCVELLERCLEAGAQIDRRVQLVLIIEALINALGDRLQPAARR